MSAESNYLVRAPGGAGDAAALRQVSDRQGTRRQKRGKADARLRPAGTAETAPPESPDTGDDEEAPHQVDYLA